MMIGWLTLNVWKLTWVTSHHKADTTEFTVHSNTLEKCCDWTVVYKWWHKKFPYSFITHLPSSNSISISASRTGHKKFVKLIWCIDYLVTHLWETLLIWNDLLNNGAQVLCNLVHFGRGTMHTGYVSGRIYKQKWQKKSHLCQNIMSLCQGLIQAW